MSDEEMTIARRANPQDPLRVSCARCGDDVVRVYIDTREVLVDHPEVAPDDDLAGLFVAVDALGAARVVRLPGGLAGGEALYSPHELRCHA